MKNSFLTMKTNVSKYSKLVLVLSSLVLCMPAFLFAQGPGSDVDVVIKYVGQEGQNIIFQLEVDSKTTEPYTVRIKDHEGSVLFYKTYRDKKLSKKLVFNKEEIGEAVTFIVNTKKDQQIETYQLDRNVRVVEDLVVTKQ